MHCGCHKSSFLSLVLNVRLLPIITKIDKTKMLHKMPLGETWPPRIVKLTKYLTYLVKRKSIYLLMFKLLGFD